MSERERDGNGGAIVLIVRHLQHLLRENLRPASCSCGSPTRLLPEGGPHGRYVFICHKHLEATSQPHRLPSRNIHRSGICSDQTVFLHGWVGERRRRDALDCRNQAKWSASICCTPPVASASYSSASRCCISRLPTECASSNSKEEYHLKGKDPERHLDLLLELPKRRRTLISYLTLAL